MSSDIGTRIAKYVLCIFNFPFFVLGTILFGSGIWLAVDKASLIALLRMAECEHVNQLIQPAVIEQLTRVLLICGAILFFLSFLGFFGGLRKSSGLLTTYGCLMAILLGAEMIAGGLALLYKERAHKETKTFLQSSIAQHYSTAENANAVTMMWNQMMASFSCCGVNDYNDFNSSESWMANKGRRRIPEACCILSDSTKLIPRDAECSNDPNEANSNRLKGCYDAFTDWIISHVNTVNFVLIGVGSFQFLLIFLAFC